YGIINLQDYKVVVGPTRQLPISDQELKTISFSLGIPMSSTDDFLQQMKTLASLPLMSLLQILCMVNFSFTKEKKTLESIAIHEEKQNSIRDEMEKTDTERVIQEHPDYGAGPYNALDIENRLLDMVMRGDVAALSGFFANAPAVRSGTVAQEQSRQSKNIFIVTATLVSRAAIRGGMDVTTALGLSDQYIQRCELADSPDAITELNYRMLMDYAERVAKLRLGQNPSVLVTKVSNYIQQHLSEPIKTEDIAKALYVGRSRLSTNFKKETGMNLSDYIVQIKIDEAKRLLRYSNKNFASIALFLGFSSQSHFSKVFKENTDSTPLEYRQLHKHY
ncbi:MAG: helix-turn-helix domain-containing protein, partial [Bacilli bacterium]|nr:helix-turn-helix domain-containing protein [Bacilli bacterium]